MSQQPQFQRAESPLDEFKLRLVGDVQPGAQKKPFLEVRFLKNQPSLTVVTNVPEDAAKENGKIRAGLDTYTFFALMRMMEKMDGLQGDDIDEMPVLNDKGPNFRKGGEVDTLETIYIGRKGGRNYISIVRFGRPKIPFYFGPSEWHEFANRDGSPCSQVDVSSAYMMAWVDVMRGWIPHIANVQYTDRNTIMESWNNKGNSGGGNRGGQGGGGNWKNNNGGGGGNWKNNNGGGNGNQGGGGNASADFEDDIPF